MPSLEIISVNIWHTMNSATVAYSYRKVVNEYYDRTVSEKAIKKAEAENGKLTVTECNISLPKASRAAACGDFDFGHDSAFNHAYKRA